MCVCGGGGGGGGGGYSDGVGGSAAGVEWSQLHPTQQGGASFVLPITAWPGNRATGPMSDHYGQVPLHHIRQSSL